MSAELFNSIQLFYLDPLCIFWLQFAVVLFINDSFLMANSNSLRLLFMTLEQLAHKLKVKSLLCLYSEGTMVRIWLFS
jgi:hypothetical protein